MVVIGIDLGIRAQNPTGIAVLSFAGIQPCLIATVELIPHMGESWQARVQSLAGMLAARIEEHSGAMLAYEEPFDGKNPQTFRKLACAEGMVLTVAQMLGRVQIGVSNAEAKQALTGDAGATKQMMIAAVRMQYGVPLSSHMADAVGVALAGEAKMRRAQIQARV